MYIYNVEIETPSEDEADPLDDFETLTVNLAHPSDPQLTGVEIGKCDEEDEIFYLDRRRRNKRFLPLPA